MNNAVIKAVGLTKKYGELIAVNDISFEVEPGSLLAILGPNGAGKTTTVEMLEGFIKPDSGTISILGFNPYLADRKQIQGIGGVLQESQAEPFIKVRELLTQRSRYYDDPVDVDELLSLMELVDKANSLVKNLSGGQRRKLEVALAIVGNPKVIFLDEPTVGFDPSARRNLWEMIDRLKNDKRTIVLTTHYMDEAEYLATDVIVLSSGKIIAQGTPKMLRDSFTQNVQISFDKEDKIDLTGLNCKLQNIDSKIIINTAEPTRILHELTKMALASDVELAGLEVKRPTLEDVFLKLSER